MMKYFNLLFLCLPLFFFSQILDKYPKGQDFYKGGIVELYKDINQVIVQNEIQPCENKKELYHVKLLLTKEAKIKFVKDFDSVNVSQNKCAYDLSLQVLKSLKDKWQPAVVKNSTFDSVIEFFVYPDDLFGNYVQNYNPEQFYIPATYKGGKEKFDKDLKANFKSLFTDYHINGRFYLDFYIATNGEITNPNLQPDIRNPVFTKEVYRTLYRMNKKWMPALFKGIPVKSKISLPIGFSVDFYER